jgi:C-terminal processing protease CtpA/Prc
MKKLAALIIALGCFILPADARLLVGMVEYQEVEGKIGVKVSTQGKVHRVHPHSPAEVAGLKEGDVIKMVDGRKNNVLNIHGTPGTLVSLTVERGGDVFAVDVPRIDYRQIEPE